METPVCGFFTESMLQLPEGIALPKIQPNIWIRYVNDAFVIIMHFEINENETQTIIRRKFRQDPVHKGVGK